jgi:DNA repair exonuclease SbcCD ATPase subunit
MINIKKLTYKNFLSTGNNQVEYEFKDPATLISGKNGSGKSTMMDALCFGLFGKAFRLISKGRLINTVNNKDCLVTVELVIHGVEYRVIRGIKPNIFEIYRNGTLLNQTAATKDYQEHLEKHILHTSYKTFCQLVILGNANWQSFMSLKAADRRKVVEDLLDIEVFSTMNVILKERISHNKETSIRTENSIAIIQARLDANEQSRKLLADKSSDGIYWINENIKKEREEYEAFGLAVELHKINQKTLVDKLYKYEPIALARDKLNLVISTTQSIISNKTKVIKYYANADSCDDCGQKLAADFVSTKIAQATEELEAAQIKFDQASAKLIKVRATLAFAEELRDQLIDVEYLITAHTNDQKTSGALIARMEDDLIEAEKPNEKIDDDHDQAAMAQLQGTAALLLAERERFDVAALLLKDTGIKSLIVQQYIPMINKIVNEYLKQMSFFVKFTLDENFDETIKAQHKESYVYESFSQGEKMRIDLALLFTWREIAKHRNQSPCNLLILDEIIDGSLDDEGTDEFMDIIFRLTKENITYIISHKSDQIFDLFDHVIKITKTQNFSKAEHLTL